jgi:DNA-binding NtrC family response regulator
MRLVMLKAPPSAVVVSGDATSLHALARALTGRPLPVALATGWADGESWLHRIPVSLIVTDVEELGREDLATLVRLRREFPHIAVIALVSFLTPEALAAEADGVVAVVLPKPVALSHLEEAVNSALFRKVAR